ncbi:MAG: hypothetical protein OSB03_10075 [Vicinamibacterales bacterium]|jgi:hypothetical protein|nr:hypothetical protein [Vicinamibacterales bacterium]
MPDSSAPPTPATAPRLPARLFINYASDEGLLRCQIVIAVLTPTSVAPDRQWVQYEQERASDLLLSVIPCLFEPEEAFMQEGLLPQRFAPTSVIGFAEDPDEGFRRLLNAIGDRMRGVKNSPTIPAASSTS